MALGSLGAKAPVAFLAPERHGWKPCPPEWCEAARFGLSQGRDSLLSLRDSRLGQRMRALSCWAKLGRRLRRLGGRLSAARPVGMGPPPCRKERERMGHPSL